MTVNVNGHVSVDESVNVHVSVKVKVKVKVNSVCRSCVCPWLCLVTCVRRILPNAPQGMPDRSELEGMAALQ